MSEDTATEETTEETGEKSPEQSFSELRAQKEALEAELRPLKVKAAVEGAGFNPNTPEGKALARLADIDADAESVKALATELGFEASQTTPKHEPTANERAAQEFANRQSELNQVTSSDEPPSDAQAIAEAEQSGDYAKAMSLKLKGMTVGG